MLVKCGPKKIKFVHHVLLALFAFGSVVAAMAVSIWGVILGRALQGSGEGVNCLSKMPKASDQQLTEPKKPCSIG